MSNKIKTYFNWSSGKDASLALHYLQQEEEYSIDKLVTTVNSHYDRVSMHGLRKTMLEAQMRSLDLPGQLIELPEEPSMEEYNNKMQNAVAQLRNEGYTHGAFGDIFLEDLRAYREEQLKPHGISCLFPLWKKDTSELMKEFLELGFKAIVICIKAELLDVSFLGRMIDQEFLDELPENVDPCGENGEFHTFCFDGPIFNHPVKFEVDQKIYKEYKNPDVDVNSSDTKGMGFWFCDLLPEENK